MARVLTGVQSTGLPHLGNIMGAMLPAIEMANASDDDSFLFIADLHSLTTIRDGELLRNNTYSVAATWLALGLDVEKSVFYRQSKVPEVCELAWYLNCFMKYNRLQLATSFKDKSGRMEDVNAGLFTYPVLMAADILLYDAEVVPVGKDQKQHLEFTQVLANRINHLYGNGEKDSILVVPEVKHKEETMVVPGIGGLGTKMSKSQDNTILVLGNTDKKLKKNVGLIVTDSTPLEDPKEPENVVTALLDLVDKGRSDEVRQKLQAGNYGWGHAKGELTEALLDYFGDARQKYTYYMENRGAIDEALATGEAKAREVAKVTLERCRKVLGY